MTNIGTIIQSWTLGVGRWTFIFALSLLLLSFTNSAGAEKTKNSQANDNAPKKQAKQQKTQKAIWPKPFTPSEKISADQAVAFPVDI